MVRRCPEKERQHGFICNRHADVLNTYSAISEKNDKYKLLIKSFLTSIVLELSCKMLNVCPLDWPTTECSPFEVLYFGIMIQRSQTNSILGNISCQIHCIGIISLWNNQILRKGGIKKLCTNCLQGLQNSAFTCESDCDK